MMKRMKYGIKAYGKWFRFATKTEYRDYLTRWFLNTEGSERDRAVLALDDLMRGRNFTDTDLL